MLHMTRVVSLESERMAGAFQQKLRKELQASMRSSDCKLSVKQLQAHRSRPLSGWFVDQAPRRTGRIISFTVRNAMAVFDSLPRC